MPKTKRNETKRRAKIARANANPLPKQQGKAAPGRSSPSYKAPARGVARYPWLVTILLILVAGGIFTLYANHIGPFAPQAHPKSTPVVYATVPPASKSPCISSSILDKITDTSPAPSQEAFDKTTHTYSQPPAMTLQTKKLYCAGINTNRGLIVIELDAKLAPNTVNNFVFLAQHHFYDGIKFHRVLPDKIIQGGDPKGDGTGGPGYKFDDEPVQGDYTAGTIAMANSGANTNGSQFFINTGDNSKVFQKNYNLFGHVVQGLDIAQKIQGPGDDASTKNIASDVMNHVVVVAA